MYEISGEMREEKNLIKLGSTIMGIFFAVILI